MKPSSAKAKGRTFQQMVKAAILAKNPELEDDDVRSTSMGAGGEDLQLSPAARRLVPFQIECKSRARISVYEWFKQAAEHGKHEPLLIVKQDRSEPLAIIRADTLLGLIRSAYGR